MVDEKDPLGTSVHLQRNYLALNVASGIIGGIAVVLQMAQEKWGAAHPQTNRLIDQYNAALDAAKKGIKVAFPSETKQRLLFNPGAGIAPGYPCFMVKRAFEGEEICRDGSSNSALGKMWGARNRYLNADGALLVFGETGERPGLDEELRVLLPTCTLCSRAVAEEAVGEHLFCCKRLHQLQQQSDEKLPPDERLISLSGESEAERQFHTKWVGHCAEAARELKALKTLVDDGGKRRAGSSLRRKDEVFMRGYLQMCDRYRRCLLDDYTEAEHERPCGKLLAEVWHLYAVVYSSSAPSLGLAFVWHVAGPYLCHLKARHRHHLTHPGAPPRLTDPGMLVKVLSNAKRAVVPSEETEGAEPEADPDGDVVSTPWTRCAT